MLIECGCMNVLHSRGVPCETALYHILLGNKPFSGSFAKNFILTRLAQETHSTTPVGAVSNRTGTQHSIIFTYGENHLETPHLL